ncbi:MAG: hypothetical protein A2017_08535 [Lentisphaerae bacterium GWF2_44_16]|nr:MAG: hypothetical protein A2017_08535 [Lentisphaerae bacterium GWF2_44_16]
MGNNNFMALVVKITEKDSRYAPEAYEFIRDAVNYTAAKLERDKLKNKHVSGHELLKGVVEYAVQEFGPLAKDVLTNWGIQDGISVGNIVFNMVQEKLLSANDKDSIDDFSGDLDFEEFFSGKFSPENKKPVNPPIIA